MSAAFSSSSKLRSMAPSAYKKGTTVLFALWPDHIRAVSDGRSVIVRPKKYVHDEEFVQIWDGDEEKMFLMGNNIVCFVGVYDYCSKAYDMLQKEIGSRVVDKKVLTEAVDFVQKEYIEKFVKCSTDENVYAKGFPGGIFIVGFDGEYYLGEQNSEENPKPTTYSRTIDNKEVKFVGCGGGAFDAIEHLKEQFEGQRELKTVDEVSELLAESLVYTSLYDWCTGGTFQCIKYSLGGTPVIVDERPHVIAGIVKYYEHIDLKDALCILVFAKFDRDATEKEYVFEQNLKDMLHGIQRIINLGGSKPDQIALRLLFFGTNKLFAEALKILQGPPVIDDIKGVGIHWTEDISKDFFKAVISDWEKQEMF